LRPLDVKILESPQRLFDRKAYAFPARRWWRQSQEPLPEGLTPHSLRRTCASLPFAIGETPPYVMAQLGHADPKVTLGIYAKVMDRRDGEPERLKALVEGVFRQPLDSKAIQTPAATPTNGARKPVESGIPGA
jgi:integrase